MELLQIIYFKSTGISHWFSKYRTERLQKHLLLFATNRTDRFFCEGCTWHNIHVLVTTPLCCYRKARAGSAQSFTLWQQANNRDHTQCSLYYCLFAPHIHGTVLLFTHISVRHGDAAASPTLKNWPLFGQKFSKFGQSIQLHSHVMRYCLFSKLRQNNKQINGKIMAKTAK